MNMRTFPRWRLTTYLVLGVSLLFSSFVIAAEADADNDGVPDKLDKCPGSSSMSQVSPDFKYRHAITQDRLQSGGKPWPVDEHGCELDSDGDGVIDSKDYCPEDSVEAIALGVAKNGCPKHSDFDGTPDYRDRCPNTPKGVATDQYGCPK